jgi:hypothetical protein
MLTGCGDVGVAIDALLRLKLVWVVTVCTVSGWGDFPKETTIVQMGTPTKRDLVLNPGSEGITGCGHVALLAQLGCCTDLHVLTRGWVQPGDLTCDPILVHMVASLARDPYPFFLRNERIAFCDT